MKSITLLHLMDDSVLFVRREVLPLCREASQVPSGRERSYRCVGKHHGFHVHALGDTINWYLWSVPIHSLKN
jgi:hypothetical protein